MKTYVKQGMEIVRSPFKGGGDEKWAFKEKLLLGLSFRKYLTQALRNPFNWVLAVIFAVGLPLIVIRFIYGLGAVTSGSNDYPWGLFLTFGLFTMVPLSASGFMVSTAVDIFGRHDFQPIEPLALLNGLLGYFFAVVYLLVDLGQPWRLPYPMVVSFGAAAVLFLVGWHVATYLSVQVLEVAVSFFEWINFPIGKQAIKRITLGLTVAGIILSTLHQGALGALFNYAPGKVHPLWYSAPFGWIMFLCSSIPAGLCMVIAVSTIARKTMRWRCDANFTDHLDSLTVGLAKGASMGLITYLVLKMIALAHDNKWAYLATGWGGWYLLEIFLGVLLPLVLFAYAVRHRRLGIIRATAFLTIFGVVLNRFNTAMIAFNWNLYQEIPGWKEVVICLTLFSTYLVVYRFILYRLPILYTWKEAAAQAAETVPEKLHETKGSPAPAGVFRLRDN